ncbi:MAG: TetR/AcrR family transcriptional regulator [Desulfarculus sp.]|jgi:AcrR family transcriptional regulator|nr:MAG: TetR/AcrR family transcriptional regulator [Desulfarculus sp.]
MSKRQNQKKRRFLPPGQRRGEILKAAAQVFSEKGYYKTRISDIAARAKMGHGTVYRFFPSKRVLATEVVGARGATGFFQSLRENTIEESNPSEFFMTIGANYLGNLGERLPIIRFSIAEAISSEELARQYYENLLQTLFDKLSEAVSTFQEKGIFKEGDSFLLGHIFYSMLFGFLYSQELLYGKEITHIEKQRLIETVVDVFLNGVRKA